MAREAANGRGVDFFGLVGEKGRMTPAFPWYQALAGGALIGLASSLGVLATGKIPGMSGMFSRVLRPQRGDTAWRMLFFVGLLIGAGIAFARSEAAGAYHPVHSTAAILIAGLLVGFGTRLGGGCTSGHGVCGIGMGSRTAFVATLVFMLAGMITVGVLQHSSLNSILP